jgi:hypothetical protein
MSNLLLCATSGAVPTHRMKLARTISIDWWCERNSSERPCALNAYGLTDPIALA